MKRLFYALFISMICISMVSDVQKKMVRQKGFDIECYVSIKPLKNYNKTKMYHWFKAGKLYNTLGNSGGPVLHEEYSRYHRSNQLVEQGEFNLGLKDGDWKTWYEDGQLKTVIKWINGYRQGRFYSFNSIGNLIESGNYNRNRKSGRWINYISKDTTYIKNDSVYSVKPKTKTAKIIEKIFPKRDSIEKQNRKKLRKERRRRDSIDKANNPKK